MDYVTQLQGSSLNSEQLHLTDLQEERENNKELIEKCERYATELEKKEMLI
jgi:hypothetical protein